MAATTIVGTGRYLPGDPIPNDALARVMDTDDAWIRQRTGIRQRHFVEPGITVSDLAAVASQAALEAAGIAATAVDYIIFATMTPDYAFPGSGSLLGAKLGIAGVPALDIRQQCAAMPFGLQLADSLLASQAASTVLLVGAEAHAGLMPWRAWDVVRSQSTRAVSEAERAYATKHRGYAVIFGDGAGALLLRRSPVGCESAILGSLIHSDGHQAEQIHLRAGGFRSLPHLTTATLQADDHLPRMTGRDLFKQAVTRLPAVIRALCAQHGVTLDDVDHFIAHQANDRINQAVREALGIAPERVPSNIARYGNTSGATIPILLDELARDGRLQAGQLVCVFALGSGLHWGATLLRW